MSSNIGKDGKSKLICYSIVPTEHKHKNALIIIFLDEEHANQFITFTQKFPVRELKKDEDGNYWCSVDPNEYYSIMEMLVELNQNYMSQDFVFDFNTGSAFCAPVKGQGTILGLSMDNRNFVLDVLSMDEKQFSSKLHNDSHSN
jgi:hypothetical protein